MMVAALDENDNLARLIMKLYDEYTHSIQNHMRYEEKTVFPYVERLQAGESDDDFDIETFSKHHEQTDKMLRELKLMIIKYLPADAHHNNQLTATLYDIYNIAAEVIISDFLNGKVYGYPLKLIPFIHKLPYRAAGLMKDDH